MTSATSPAAEVLIAGAGPTGLVLALWLTRLGVRVRIIDRAAEPGTTSRALAVQARTLELYRQLELTEAVLEGGWKVPAINLWAQGVAWLKDGLDNTLTTRGITRVALANAVACFASPTTDELLVVSRDGFVTRVPLPR